MVNLQIGMLCGVIPFQRHTIYGKPTITLDDINMIDINLIHDLYYI